MANQQKQRHGCLLAFLLYMLIANVLTACFYFFGRDLLHKTMPDVPDWTFIFLGVACFVNIMLVVALFRWKKWGFWGVVVIALLLVPINISLGISLPHAMAGLLGPVVLYGVLHIGKGNKGWPQLE